VAGVDIPSEISFKGGIPLPAGAGSDTEILAGADVDVVDAEVEEVDTDVWVAAADDDDEDTVLAAAGAAPAGTWRLWASRAFMLPRSWALVTARRAKRKENAWGFIVKRVEALQRKIMNQRSVRVN
jgi:hypothetical protein